MTRLAVAGAVVAAVASQTSSVPHADEPPAAPAHRVLTAWSAPAPGPFAADDLRPGSVRQRPATPPPRASAATVKAVDTKGTARPSQDMPAPGTAQYELALAYRHAAAKAPDGCHVTVFQLAAIGQVESGSIGGREVTEGNRVTATPAPTRTTSTTPTTTPSSSSTTGRTTPPATSTATSTSTPPAPTSTTTPPPTTQPEPAPTGTTAGTTAGAATQQEGPTDPPTGTAP